MRKVLWSFLFILSFVIFPLSSASAATDEALLVEEIKELITENYVGNINGDLQSATTIAEIIQMLDPYSEYFSKEEMQRFNDNVNLSSIGLGINITEHADGIQVLHVYKGGGAADAGIVAGDIITAINGQSVVGSSVQEASSLLSGNAGTQVQLNLLHEDGTTSTKVVARKRFTIPNVESDLLFGNVGYILLRSFSEDGAQLVKDALVELQQRGATSFIFDLQNNGGGYVKTAEELTGLFPNAKIAYLFQQAQSHSAVRAVQQNVQFPANTRVLVNRYSASASEMLAASLQDQQSAILYGETTYGKGSAQGFFTLHDDSYLKLTIGHFTGPSGQTINGVGVKPNVPTTTSPIFQAHYDAIKEQFKDYQELEGLSISTTKVLTVKFSQHLSTPIPEGSVQLITLGGSEIPVTIKAEEGDSLTITPTKPLSKGKEYMLLVHPTLQTSTGDKPQNGMYLHIAVAN